MRKTILAAIVLAIAALVIYAPSLKNEFVIWDDDSLVYENPLTQELSIKNIAGAFSSYDPELYVPLTIVSFQIEHALFGFNPFFFHVTNLLLHIACGILVMMLLMKLGLRHWTAFFCALIFVVHPINTEAVAWVSARKDVMAALFSLGALIVYIRYRETNRKKFFWMTVALFILGLLSKPVTILLPLVFLLTDWLRDSLTASKIKTLWPLFLLSLLFLIIGLYGKQQNISALTPIQTILLAAKSTVFALQKFFLPYGYSPIYLQTDAISLTLPQFFVPVLILIILGIATLLSLRTTSAVMFCALFFLLFLVPAFSNFQKDRDVYFFSDRYIYIAQVGLLFLIGMGVERLMKRPARIAIGAIPIAAFLGWTAHAQSALWKDSETLYRDALTKNERSVVMHYNLALLEHHRGNREEALKEYERALEIDPSYSKAFNNLGVFYKEEGQIDRAMELFEKALAADPKAADAHNNIGTIFMDRGDVDAAIEQYRKAIEIDPLFAQAHINLASAYGRKGMYEEGLEQYRLAFEADERLRAQYPQIAEALEAAAKKE